MVMMDKKKCLFDVVLPFHPSFSVPERKHHGQGRPSRPTCEAQAMKSTLINVFDVKSELLFRRNPDPDSGLLVLWWTRAAIGSCRRKSSLECSNGKRNCSGKNKKRKNFSRVDEIAFLYTMVLYSWIGCEGTT
jgi:hypothetical protein